MLNFPWIKTACYPIRGKKKKKKNIETKTIIRIMPLGQLPN